jgi:hypothetical protein
MERNPFLILGIPFGASREQANIAFARRSRALRRAGGAKRTELTDLTWALNQIDEATASPSTFFGIFRVPADAETFNAPGPGALHPPPETLPPRGGDREAALAGLQAQATLELLRYLVQFRAGQVPVPPP